MDCSTVVILCASFYISTHVSAVTLTPCVNDGNLRVAEVERGKTSSFTCRGFQAGNIVKWDYLRDDGEEFSAGKCPPLPASCQLGAVGSPFTASRSDTESVMTVDPSQKEDLVRNGTLSCDTSVGTDTCRLDLTNKPERLSFKLGSGSQTEVTVKENTTVLLTCEADSRPVASMTVVRQEGTERRTEIRSGQSPLTFNLTPSCTDTGTYLCFASNVIGQADTFVSGKLNVECNPRIARTEKSLELNYNNQSTSRDFDVIAYPALSRSFSSFKYLEPDGTDPASDTSNITLIMTCQQKPGALYISTCTLIVLNMASPAAAGFYTVTLSNSEGSHDVRFKALYNHNNAAQSNDKTGESPTSFAAVAVGLGVVLALSLIVNVFFVILLCRRRRILQSAQGVDQPQSKSTSDRESISMDLSRQHVRRATGATDASNPYEDLNTADIGQRSIYSEIAH